MGTIVFIVMLAINVTGGAVFGTIFSTQHPQEPPREEQTISREETNVWPPDTAPDKTQPNETPSAEER